MLTLASPENGRENLRRWSQLGNPINFKFRIKPFRAGSLLQQHLSTENTVIQKKIGQSCRSTTRKCTRKNHFSLKLKEPIKNWRFLVSMLKQLLEKIETKCIWFWYTVLYLSKMIVWTHFWICKYNLPIKNKFWSNFSWPFFGFQDSPQRTTTKRSTCSRRGEGAEEASFSDGTLENCFPHENLFWKLFWLETV